MPLIKGKSDKAFSQNVRTEMEHGKSQPQSLAIAYSMKRKAKAMGGSVDCYADGGQVEDNYQSPSTSKDQEHHKLAFLEDETRNYMPPMEPGRKHDMAAMEEDDRDLNQHGEDEQGPYGMAMAEGGFIGSHQDKEHELDLVGRIMKQRQQHFSEGGRVANKTPRIGGSEDNNFDDLYLDDDIESSYTGANSGDEDGDPDQDARDEDVVARIMRSRKKKNMMPMTEKAGL